MKGIGRRPHAARPGSSRLMSRQTPPPSPAPHPEPPPPRAGSHTLLGFLPAAETSGAPLAPRPPTGRGHPAVRALDDQRRLLALLYRAAVRCLQARSPGEVEGVLLMALRRATGAEGAFIALRAEEGWRVRCCDRLSALGPDTAAAISSEALADQVAVAREMPGDLAARGVPGRWLAVATMVAEGAVTGAVGVTSEADLSDDGIEFLAQLAILAAAALRPGG